MKGQPMKHTTEELIFAALLRQRMQTLRMSKTADMTDDEERAFNEQPANGLVEEAMKELQGIATLVKQIQARDEPTQKT